MTDAKKKKLKIILAEDDHEDIALLKRALTKTGISYDLKIASDGAMLLELLDVTSSEDLPNLVILDLKMPKMDGHESLSAIRSNPLTRQLPVVILTSSNSTEDIDLSYSYGCDSYFVKPSTFNELIELTEVFRQTMQIST